MPVVGRVTMITGNASRVVTQAHRREDDSRECGNFPPSLSHNLRISEQPHAMVSNLVSFPHEGRSLMLLSLCCMGSFHAGSRSKSKSRHDTTKTTLPDLTKPSDANSVR